MKTISTFFMGLIVLFLLAEPVSAQKLSAENTYEISGKANRGYLGNINVDESKNLIELTYVTKSNDKMAKFETYQFDLNFNFLRLQTDEIEFDKAKTKYKWFKYRGEDYSVNAISVEANLVGTLVLKRKLITYHWNWFWGGYDVRIKLLEKLKPKSDEGNKFQVWTKAENNETGDVIVLVTEKPKIKKGVDPYLSSKKFHILQINPDLDIVNDKPFEFNYPQALVSSQIIASNNSDGSEEDGSDDISAADLGVLLAPAGMGKKVSDPDPNNYTFLRISNKAELLDRITVKSGMSVWGINAIITDNGSTFIFGPSKGDKKYFNQVLAAGVDPETMKWDHFQIAKITNGSTSFVNAVALDEFENKLQTPPSQKKAPAYKGKKFAFSSIGFSTSGDIFIMGQNFSLAKDNNGYQYRKYKDPLMFQFSNDGRLKAQYGVRRDENNKYAEASPCYQHIMESNDNKSIYWIIGEVDGVRADKELGASKYKVLMYPSVAKVDIEGAKIGDFVKFGQDKYYLNNRFPYLPVDQNHSIVFFGENKNGRTLWFGKMPVDN